MATIKRIIFFITLSFIIYDFASAQSPYTLEKITVRRPNNYSLETFTREEFEQKNLNSLVDIFNYVSGLDLRYRGTFGIQGDISLRGSTYEQVAVLIDGIKVMDPQTGHHNLDIPLTAFDVERIEVIREASSSLYGAGAFAGSVNIITKKPTKKALNLETVFGEHALFGQAFSYSLPFEDSSTRLSFDHKISKAARPNTDFEYETGSFYFNKDFGSTLLDTLFGYQKKDFGADSFYSNLFPEEQEHTQTLFFKTGLDSRLGSFNLKNNLYLRRHDDKFILNRNNPTSVNYHTTYIYGQDSSLNLPTKFGNLTFGLNTGRDEINSTNLGKHARLYEAGIFGLFLESGKINTDLRFRLDHYQKWSWQESFNLGLGYQLINEKLNLKGSLARAFRLPSFTELYYSDAANKGSSDLGIEKSDTFTLGLDFKEKSLSLNVEGFLRRGHNLIDWTRTSTSDVWLATNLGRIDFRGIAFNSQLKPDLNYKSLKLGRVRLSYSYTDADRKASGFFSKYALDILMHQFILGLESSIFGLSLDWQLSYNKRYYGETYFVGNLYIGKKFSHKDFNLEPFLKIDNFTNTEYSEIAGVLQPKRWIQSGIKFEW